MAPVLQCPDCGEKHPLGEVPNQGAFPCRGCGRMLKVPEVVGQRAAAAAAEPDPSGAVPAAPAVPAVPAVPTPRPIPVATAVAGPNGPAVDPSATRGTPGVDQDALGALAGRGGRRPAARLGRVPWWMRLLLWFIAVPLGFLLVFLVARAFNLFTSNQLSDLFLANNTGRFWPAARLLPFVALVTAALVQGGVYLLARWRGRRGRGAGGNRAGDFSASVGRPHS
jgi:hypothetical protein